MNPDHDQELRDLVEHELKGLQPLAAPSTLAPRIMAALAARAEAPWYRRPWYCWSLPLQATFFTLLITLFGGLCFGAWKFFQTDAVVTTTGKVAETVSLVEMGFRVLGVFRDSAIYVLESIGSGYLIGFAGLAFVAYAICMGLGSVCVRLAYVRR
jgi:hypothetical protein